MKPFFTQISNLGEIHACCVERRQVVSRPFTVLLDRIRSVKHIGTENNFFVGGITNKQPGVFTPTQKPK